MKIYWMAISLLICACSDRFPVTDLYRINQIEKICEVYKINADNITFKYSHDLPFDNCPQNVFGFSEEDAGKVSSWARRQKKRLGK